MNWYDDKSLTHLGMIEFGFNSITEIEVYRDKNGTLLFCDHDEPDDIMDIDYVKSCVEDCNHPRYDDQVAYAEKICGMKLR